ncbi:MAG: hypothetical protein RSF78_12485 [Bacteroidales bacterium]
MIGLLLNVMFDFAGFDIFIVGSHRYAFNQIFTIRHIFGKTAGTETKQGQNVNRDADVSKDI